jgi:hypothetical protein
MSKKPQDRWIVGKTIASVETHNFKNDYYDEMSTELLRIRFTDGSFLAFAAFGSEDTPWVSYDYHPTKT